MSNICEATGEFGVQNKYYLRVCPLRLSSATGLLWPAWYGTPDSVFYSSAVIQAAPFWDFWPALFPLYKCDFSEPDIKHYSSLFFLET